MKKRNKKKVSLPELKIKTIRSAKPSLAKLDSQQFWKWIEALRSGNYRQTRGTLQDSNGYCCLGVACKVLIDADKIGRDAYMSEELYGELPDDQQFAPKWLKGIDSDYSKRVRLPADTYFSYLTNLNDEDGMSFNEIADILELVYVHGIMEGNKDDC